MNPRKLSLLSALALGALIALAPATRAQEEKDSTKPATPPANGQRPPRRGGGANAFDTFAERLKLTDEQKTKVQPIFREEATKLRDIRQDTSLKPEEMREKIKTTREEFTAKMKPHLTTEQFDKLKTMREAGQRGRAPRHGGDGNTPPSTTTPPASPSTNDKK